MLLERLQGLLLMLAGCCALLLVYLAQQNGWFQLRPPTPPGLEHVPVITPLSCLLPMAALASVGLCLAGMKKLVAPDTWQPPKHLADVSRETSEAGLAPRPRSARPSSLLRRALRRLIERFS